MRGQKVRGNGSSKKLEEMVRGNRNKYLSGLFFLPTSRKCAKIMKFSQLQVNVHKLWNFANFKKMCKDYEILSTLWNWAKTMKFYQLHENM